MKKIVSVLLVVAMVLSMVACGGKTANGDDKSKNQLVVATNASFEPFEYMDGDTYYGVDMEIAKLLADELGKELVIDNMDFNAVCLSVGQQKCDIAMAGLTVNEKREEHVTFTESYYEASQKLVVPSDDTVFANCADAEAVMTALNGLAKDVTIGVQEGTTGQFFVEGDEEWGFDGLTATCKTYKNGSLAIQDMINGNIDYVIIDAAPAAAITESINSMQTDNAVTAKVLEYNLTEEENAFGVDKTQPELLEQVNDFIKKIKEEGTLEEIFNKYFGDGTPEGVTSAK